jgi:hypothetical protein
MSNQESSSQPTPVQKYNTSSITADASFKKSTDRKRSSFDIKDTENKENKSKS